MKVIIINGSPRVNGLTASVLHSVEKKLNEGGVQTEFYDLVALKAPFNDVEGAGERVEKVSSRAAKRMLSSFRAGRKPLAQRVYHLVVFRFGIKPFVLKKGDKYQGVVDRWKEAGAVKLT